MMPRFVLLTHDHPTWHWDLMLEENAVLRTWRLDAKPDSAGRIRATPLPDHRLMYLAYEGPVSGQRGTVQRWDHGEYNLISEVPGRIDIVLRGERMRGQAMLTTESEGSVYFEFVPESVQ